MLSRRLLLTAALCTTAAAPGGFQTFLAGMRTEARRAGIAPATLDRAFAGLQPNQTVIDRDRHQPEFTMTWAQYRALVISDQRIANGRAAFRQNRALLSRVRGPLRRLARRDHGHLGAGIQLRHRASATSTWSRRWPRSPGTAAAPRFFRTELMAALHILDHGDVSPARMTGCYAGAMGQPQFMPSSYLRYAVDFEGNGRRDIWTSTPDTLASIANYLEQSAGAAASLGRTGAGAAAGYGRQARAAGWPGWRNIRGLR